MKISDLVYDEIKPLLAKTDIKLVEVEYVKRADGMHLVIYIDKNGGVSIDDCVEVNRLIDDKLENLNPTNDETYALDVSSYGLDKPLKYDYQFDKYIGKLVNLSLYKKIEIANENTKSKVVELVSYSKDTFTFKAGNWQNTIDRVLVAQITPHIEF